MSDIPQSPSTPTEQRQPPIWRWSSIAALFADAYILNTELEGGNFARSIETYIPWLCAGVQSLVAGLDETSYSNRLAQLQEAISTASEKLQYAGEWQKVIADARGAATEHALPIIHRLQHELKHLSVGDTLLIPAGWARRRGGHILLLLFEATSATTMRLSVLNSGGGAQFNAQSVQAYPKSQAACSLTLCDLARDDVQSETLLWTLLKLVLVGREENCFEALYEAVLPWILRSAHPSERQLLACTEAHSDEQGPWMSLQKSGTCFLRCAMAAVKYYLHRHGFSRAWCKAVTTATRLAAVQHMQRELDELLRAGDCSSFSSSDVAMVRLALKQSARAVTKLTSQVPGVASLRATAEHLLPACAHSLLQVQAAGSSSPGERQLYARVAEQAGAALWDVHTDWPEYFMDPTEYAVASLPISQCSAQLEVEQVACDAAAACWRAADHLAHVDDDAAEFAGEHVRARPNASFDLSAVAGNAPPAHSWDHIRAQLTAAAGAVEGLHAAAASDTAVNTAWHVCAIVEDLLLRQLPPLPAWASPAERDGTWRPRLPHRSHVRTAMQNIHQLMVAYMAALPGLGTSYGSMARRGVVMSTAACAMDCLARVPTEPASVLSTVMCGVVGTQASDAAVDDVDLPEDERLMNFAGDGPTFEFGMSPLTFAGLHVIGVTAQLPCASPELAAARARLGLYFSAVNAGMNASLPLNSTVKDRLHVSEQDITMTWVQRLMEAAQCESRLPGVHEQRSRQRDGGEENCPELERRARWLAADWTDHPEVALYRDAIVLAKMAYEPVRSLAPQVHGAALPGQAVPQWKYLWLDFNHKSAFIHINMFDAAVQLGAAPPASGANPGQWIRQLPLQDQATRTRQLAPATDPEDPASAGGQAEHATASTAAPGEPITAQPTGTEQRAVEVGSQPVPHTAWLQASRGLGVPGLDTGVELLDRPARLPGLHSPALCEEDVLHAPALPTFDGALSESDVEHLMSLLTVPLLRIPGLCEFFAGQRAHALLNHQLRDLLFAALFEPGTFGLDSALHPAILHHAASRANIAELIRRAAQQVAQAPAPDDQPDQPGSPNTDVATPGSKRSASLRDADEQRGIKRTKAGAVELQSRPAQHAHLAEVVEAAGAPMPSADTIGMAAGTPAGVLMDTLLWHGEHSLPVIHQCFAGVLALGRSQPGPEHAALASGIAHAAVLLATYVQFACEANHGLRDSLPVAQFFAWLQRDVLPWCARQLLSAHRRSNHTRAVQFSCLCATACSALWQHAGLASAGATSAQAVLQGMQAELPRACLDLPGLLLFSVCYINAWWSPSGAGAEGQLDSPSQEDQPDELAMLLLLDHAMSAHQIHRVQLAAWLHALPDQDRHALLHAISSVAMGSADLLAAQPAAWRAVSDQGYVPRIVVESPHPYLPSCTVQMPVSIPGSEHLQLVFDKATHTEPGYDYVSLYKDSSMTEYWGDAEQLFGSTAARVEADSQPPGWPGAGQPPLTIPTDNFWFVFEAGPNIQYWGYRLVVTGTLDGNVVRDLASMDWAEQVARHGGPSQVQPSWAELAAAVCLNDATRGAEWLRAHAAQLVAGQELELATGAGVAAGSGSPSSGAPVAWACADLGTHIHVHTGSMLLTGRSVVPMPARIAGHVDLHQFGAARGDWLCALVSERVHVQHLLAQHVSSGITYEIRHWQGLQANSHSLPSAEAESGSALQTAVSRSVQEPVVAQQRPRHIMHGSWPAVAWCGSVWGTQFDYSAPTNLPSHGVGELLLNCIHEASRACAVATAPELWLDTACLQLAGPSPAAVPSSDAAQPMRILMFLPVQGDRSSAKDVVGAWYVIQFEVAVDEQGCARLAMPLQMSVWQLVDQARHTVPVLVWHNDVRHALRHLPADVAAVPEPRPANMAHVAGFQQFFGGFMAHAAPVLSPDQAGWTTQPSVDVDRAAHLVGQVGLDQRDDESVPDERASEDGTQHTADKHEQDAVALDLHLAEIGGMGTIGSADPGIGSLAIQRHSTAELPLVGLPAVVGALLQHPAEAQQQLHAALHSPRAEYLVHACMLAGYVPEAILQRCSFWLSSSARTPEYRVAIGYARGEDFPDLLLHLVQSRGRWVPIVTVLRGADVLGLSSAAASAVRASGTPPLSFPGLAHVDFDAPVLLNTQQLSSSLAEQADGLTRLEHRSHILVWGMSTMLARDAVACVPLRVSLPRLRLHFAVQQGPLGGQLVCETYSGLRLLGAPACSPHMQALQELPFSLPLADSAGSLYVLSSSAEFVRPRIRSCPFSSRLVASRSASWLRACQARTYLYKLHACGTVLSSASTAAGWYLLACRLARRAYGRALSLLACLPMDDVGVASPEVQYAVRLINVCADDAHPQAITARLRAALLVYEAHGLACAAWGLALDANSAAPGYTGGHVGVASLVPVLQPGHAAPSTLQLPWDVGYDYDQYLSKLAHVGPSVRLSQREEEQLLAQLTREGFHAKSRDAMLAHLQSGSSRGASMGPEVVSGPATVPSASMMRRDKVLEYFAAHEQDLAEQLQGQIPDLLAHVPRGCTEPTMTLAMPLRPDLCMVGGMLPNLLRGSIAAWSKSYRKYPWQVKVRYRRPATSVVHSRECVALLLSLWDDSMLGWSRRAGFALVYEWARGDVQLCLSEPGLPAPADASADLSWLPKAAHPEFARIQHSHSPRLQMYRAQLQRLAIEFACLHPAHPGMASARLLFSTFDGLVLKHARNFRVPFKVGVYRNWVLLLLTPMVWLRQMHVRIQRARLAARVARVLTSSRVWRKWHRAMPHFLAVARRVRRVHAMHAELQVWAMQEALEKQQLVQSLVGQEQEAQQSFTAALEAYAVEAAGMDCPAMVLSEADARAQALAAAWSELMLGWCDAMASALPDQRGALSTLQAVAQELRQPAALPSPAHEPAPAVEVSPELEALLQQCQAPVFQGWPQFPVHLQEQLDIGLPMYEGAGEAFVRELHEYIDQIVATPEWKEAAGKGGDRVLPKVEKVPVLITPECIERARGLPAPGVLATPQAPSPDASVYMQKTAAAGMPGLEAAARFTAAAWLTCEVSLDSYAAFCSPLHPGSQELCAPDAALQEAMQQPQAMPIWRQHESIGTLQSLLQAFEQSIAAAKAHERVAGQAMLDRIVSDLRSLRVGTAGLATRTSLPEQLLNCLLQFLQTPPTQEPKVPARVADQALRLLRGVVQRSRAFAADETARIGQKLLAFAPPPSSLHCLAEHMQPAHMQALLYGALHARPEEALQPMAPGLSVEACRQLAGLTTTWAMTRSNVLLLAKCEGLLDAVAQAMCRGRHEQALHTAAVVAPLVRAQRTHVLLSTAHLPGYSGPHQYADATAVPVSWLQTSDASRVQVQACPGMVFMELSLGLILRPRQVQLAWDFLRAAEVPGWTAARAVANCAGPAGPCTVHTASEPVASSGMYCAQSLMGEGKTSVVLPLMWLLMQGTAAASASAQRAVTAITASHLLPSLRQAFGAASSFVIPLRVLTLRFDRGALDRAVSAGNVLSLTAAGCVLPEDGRLPLPARAREPWGLLSCCALVRARQLGVPVSLPSSGAENPLDLAGTASHFAQALAVGVAQARARGQVVIASPVAVKSLLLRFVEISKDAADAPAGPGAEALQATARALQRVLDLLYHSTFVMDEVDMLTSANTELNFPRGAKQALANVSERASLHMHLLEWVLLQARRAQRDGGARSLANAGAHDAAQLVCEPGCVEWAAALALRAGLQQAWCAVQPHFYLESRAFYHEYLAPLVAAVGLQWWASRWLPAAADAGVSWAVLHGYVLGKLAPSELSAAVSSDVPGAAWAQLRLLRELVHTVLPHTLSKVNGVQFGLLPAAHMAEFAEPISRRLLAVPYIGKDVPSKSSEYAHPDVVIGLTYLSLRYQGMRASDGQALLQHCRTEMQHQHGSVVDRPAYQLFDSWVQAAQAEDHAAKPPLLPLPLLQPANASHAQAVARVLGRTAPVTAYYVQHVVLPSALHTQTSRLSAAGYDLASGLLSQQVLAFSGTPSTLLPEALLPCHFEQGTETRLASTLCADQVIRCQALPASWSLASLLHDVASSTACALIDAGAAVVGLSNRHVSQLLLLLGLRSCRACVYLDARGRQFCVERAHPPAALVQAAAEAHTLAELQAVARQIDASPGAFWPAVPLNRAGVGLSERFVLFDHAHVTGVDVHMPVFGHAYMTLGKDLSFRDAAQAAWRMRGLGVGQTLTWLIPPGVAQAIGSSAGRGSWGAAAVVQWLLRQGVRRHAKQLVQLTWQRASEAWRHDALHSLLACMHAGKDEGLSIAQRACAAAFEMRVEWALHQPAYRAPSLPERLRACLEQYVAAAGTTLASSPELLLRAERGVASTGLGLGIAGRHQPSGESGSSWEHNAVGQAAEELAMDTEAVQEQETEVERQAEQHVRPNQVTARLAAGVQPWSCMDLLLLPLIWRNCAARAEHGPPLGPDLPVRAAVVASVNQLARVAGTNYRPNAPRAVVAIELSGPGSERHQVALVCTLGEAQGMLAVFARVAQYAGMRQACLSLVWPGGPELRRALLSTLSAGVHVLQFAVRVLSTESGAAVAALGGRFAVFVPAAEHAAVARGVAPARQPSLAAQALAIARLQQHASHIMLDDLALVLPLLAVPPSSAWTSLRCMPGLADTTCQSVDPRRAMPIMLTSLAWCCSSAHEAVAVLAASLCIAAALRHAHEGSLSLAFAQLAQLRADRVRIAALDCFVESSGPALALLSALCSWVPGLHTPGSLLRTTWQRWQCLVDSSAPDCMQVSITREHWAALLPRVSLMSVLPSLCASAPGPGTPAWDALEKTVNMMQPPGDVIASPIGTPVLPAAPDVPALEHGASSLYSVGPDSLQGMVAALQAQASSSRRSAEQVRHAQAARREQRHFNASNSVREVWQLGALNALSGLQAVYLLQATCTHTLPAPVPWRGADAGSTWSPASSSSMGAVSCISSPQNPASGTPTTPTTPTTPLLAMMDLAVAAATGTLVARQLSRGSLCMWRGMAVDQACPSVSWTIVLPAGSAAAVGLLHGHADLGAPGLGAAGGAGLLVSWTTGVWHVWAVQGGHWSSAPLASLAGESARLGVVARVLSSGACQVQLWHEGKQLASVEAGAPGAVPQDYVPAVWLPGMGRQVVDVLRDVGVEQVPSIGSLVLQKCQQVIAAGAGDRAGRVVATSGDAGVKVTHQPKTGAPQRVVVETTKPGFPSVILAGVCLTQGTWYYEGEVLEAGIGQVGWVDDSFVGAASQGHGVGDEANSWAVDGQRMVSWFEGCRSWGGAWKAGDVLGMLADMDRRVLAFSLNGQWLPPMGAAFVGIDPAHGITPGISLQHVVPKFAAALVWDAARMRYGPPPGALPVGQAIAAVAQSAAPLPRSAPHVIPDRGWMTQQVPGPLSRRSGAGRALLNEWPPLSAQMLVLYAANVPEIAGSLAHAFPAATSLAEQVALALTADCRAPQAVPAWQVPGSSPEPLWLRWIQLPSLLTGWHAAWMSSTLPKAMPDIRAPVLATSAQPTTAMCAQQALAACREWPDFVLRAQLPATPLRMWSAHTSGPGLACMGWLDPRAQLYASAGHHVGASPSHDGKPTSVALVPMSRAAMLRAAVRSQSQPLELRTSLLSVDGCSDEQAAAACELAQVVSQSCEDCSSLASMSWQVPVKPVAGRAAFRRTEPQPLVQQAERGQALPAVISAACEAGTLLCGGVMTEVALPPQASCTLGTPISSVLCEDGSVHWWVHAQHVASWPGTAESAQWLPAASVFPDVALALLLPGDP